MEEVVKMNAPEVQENKKLSYEELENVANNLYMKLQQADMTNMFKRLDYLFKVMKYRDAFTAEFYNKCASEIEMMISIPEVETKAE